MARAKTPPAAPVGPQFNEVRIHDKEMTLEEVPMSEAPSYRMARNGLFMLRRNHLGKGFIKQTHYMGWLKDLPTKSDAQFILDGDIMLPAKLIAQIQDFFLTVFQRQHTEAAVLLIMHAETREWRVFVPTQLVSHGGVNYVYDRSHISKGWLVAGSIHSHCDFSASHSSTDTGDAEGFEGIHLTFGHNDRMKEVDGVQMRDPSRVAMVYMNKRRFDYTPEDVADFSELGQHTAPDWWYQYVGPAKHDDPRKPVGFELYEKFKQATTIKEEPKNYLQLVKTEPKNNVTWGTGASQPYARNQTYERNMERYERMWRDEDEGIERDWEDWTGAKNRAFLKANGWEWDEKEGLWIGPASRAEQAFYSEVGVTKESSDFNAKQAALRGVKWNEEGGIEVKTDDVRIYPAPRLIEGLNIHEYWEDALPDGFLDKLLATDMVNEDDVDWAIMNPDDSTEPEAWAERLMSKMIRAMEIINQHSEYEVHITHGKV